MGFAGGGRGQTRAGAASSERRPDIRGRALEVYSPFTGREIHCAGIVGSLARPRRRCRNTALAGTLSLLAMLADCAVGPDFLPPPAPGVTGYLPGGGSVRSDKVPGQKVVAGADIPERWWELFRSRHLNELITQGIIHNNDLQAAEAAVRAAQANALAQRGALFPTIAGDFNSTREKQP